MGGSPPPPPPPARQPRENAKETSMYWRNRAYDEAVAAASNSYRAAAVLKALVDILDPLTDQQLRAAINEHYRVVSEYRRAQIIYTTTVRTFADVDGLIKSAIDKLTSIRSLGETHINNFDQSVIQYITENITRLYTQQSELQKLQRDALVHLNTIRTTYQSSPLTTDEKQAIYDREREKLVTACASATALVTDIVTRIETMKGRVVQTDSLEYAGQTRPVVSQTVLDTNEQLRSATATIIRTYTTNVAQYRRDLERASRWYDYYRNRANLVRDRNRVIINPEVFRRLLDLAKSAHMNAIYAALHGFFAHWSAYMDRNKVHPSPIQ
jgi:hypothetical protein